MEKIENHTNSPERICNDWVQEAHKITDDGWDLRLRIKVLGDEIAANIAHGVIAREDVILGMEWLKESHWAEETWMEESVEATAYRLAFGAGAIALRKTRSERHCLKIKLNTTQPQYGVE